MKTLREMMDLIESAQPVDLRSRAAELAIQILKNADMDDDSEQGYIRVDPNALFQFHVLMNTAKKQGVAEGIDHPYDRGLEDGLAGKEYNDSMYSSYKDKESYRRGRIVAKQQAKKGLAEQTTAGEAQEYTVRVVDEEGSDYTVKVTAPTEGGALHKAIVKVRNSGARPEHAQIVRQDVEEQLEETELDPVRRIEELFRDRH